MSFYNRHRLFKDICTSDFQFLPSGHGHYKVIYRSPNTGKEWTTVTSNMPLIDLTKNSDYPKRVNLIALKRMCKR